jgi:hypothetical protein
MNLLYLGGFALGTVYSVVDPRAQPELWQGVGEAFSPSGTLGPLTQAYLEGRLAAAMLWTFGVNLVLGSVLYLSLPSLVVPFAGLAMGVLRGIIWGVLFSPLGPLAAGFELGYLPHVLTALIEGEAYVVAMLGVWLWWWPVVRGRGERWRAWREGLALQPRVYVAVAFLLALAAVWEAIEVIYLLPGAPGN